MFSRKPAAEWLDDNLGTPDEVQSALRSLRFVNRWFGGNRLHRILLEAIAERTGTPEISVLEVAAGHAEVLKAAALVLNERGVTVQATLLDRQSSHLPTSWPAGLPKPEVLAGDALALPLADKSMDVVSCCLFLHHLDVEQAIQFLREATRVARVAVLVNDLERTRLHYLLARLFALVDPSRLSRHDGPVSVRQAHSRAELQAMAAQTGRPFSLRRRFLYRHALLIWCD